jgi:hypothetical protein
MITNIVREYLSTGKRRLTTEIRSEKCVVRRFRRCANVHLHKLRKYSLLHTWYSLLFLGYKTVQHVTVLNTVGNCNAMLFNVILYYIILYYIILYYIILYYIIYHIIYHII